jgi:uncharacterized protein (TIGR03382 family)
MNVWTPSAVALAVGCWGSTALACGGFFCDTAGPQQLRVDQTAERIVFAVDESNETVEVHVQISFEGEADDFAWIVPVPQEPEIFPSVDDLFSRLQTATAPQWNLTFEVEGKCKQERTRMFAEMDVAMSATEDSAPEPSAGGFDVTVGMQGPIGPYEAVTLQAATADDLLGWLQENEYDLPDALGPKLDPYVSSDSWFVALRMGKSSDTGDLVPLGMRYSGTDPMIPLQLTAIAATPDMRLEPYILGAARAVPENYLHVQVNPFAVNWLNNGGNYDEVITRAANESGGQGLATDFAGPTADLGSLFWTESAYTTGAIRTETTAFGVMRAMFERSGIPVSAGTAPVISDFVDFPPAAEDMGFDDLGYYQCLGDSNCNWQLDGVVDFDAAVDGAAFADALESDWIEPMRQAQDLLDSHDWLSRLRSSISAEEMTVDPRFVLNKEMGAVSNQHNATLITECRPALFEYEAPRRLVLEDGRYMKVPPSEEVFDWDLWIDRVGGYAAQVVETTGRSGGAVAITDNTDAINAALDELNAAAEATYGAGCGCQSAGGGSAVALGLLTLLGVRRRRR